MKLLTALPTLSLTLLLPWMASGLLSAEELLVPVVEGPWTQITGNPDLGQYTSDRQQPVDFAVWQAADGTWQLWSCIRHTKCGGHTRLFYCWEGQNLTSPNWKPMGIAMESDPSLGEDAGGLQAPHVVQEGGKYHMFYGDWNFICHAVSDDGKKFERVIQPNGKTGMFTEGEGANTRDIVMLKAGDLWHGYYTAFPNGQGADYVRTTPDFKNWSESTTVAFGGLAGTGRGSAECPHVIKRHGRFYLFRTQRYGQNNISTVYHSEDPKMFGINQDDRYLATRLAVAAPEIVRYKDQDYIVALNLGLDGIRIAKLEWKKTARVGRRVLSFEGAEDRAAWRIESGKFANPFTRSNRTQFARPQTYFIGTAELEKGGFDDGQTGVIRSPEFEIEEDEYFVFLSGGRDPQKLYVALVDAETGEEISRVTNASDDNTLSPRLIQTKKAVGRRVYLRVVDQATGPWGHINFGGLFAAQR